MRITLSDFDSPPSEIRDKVVKATVTRRIQRSTEGGGAESWVAALDERIKVKRGDSEFAISHLVLSDQWVGGHFTPGVTFWPVQLMLVTDSTLLQDELLDPNKVEYVTWAVARGVR
jgi:hypothetical protein